MCCTCRKHFPVLSSFMTYHRVCYLLTRRVSLVEQELIILPEHLSLPLVFGGVRVLLVFLVFCVAFCLFYGLSIIDCPFVFLTSRENI